MLEEHFTMHQKVSLTGSTPKSTGWAGRLLTVWVRIAGFLFNTRSHDPAEKNYQKSEQSSLYDDDTVVPFHCMDDDPEFRHAVGMLVFRVDAVLDTEKLRAGVDRLYQLDGWYKLGARIRKNKDGKLEHHIPAKYTKDRPAFTWMQQDMKMKLADHPAAGMVPDNKPRAVPTIFTAIDTWKEALYPTDLLPSKLEHYLSSDLPPGSIHVASFQDSTLITLAYPHCTIDAIGASHFMRTWTAIIAGKEDKILPFFEDYNTDVVKNIIDSQRTPPEKYVLYDKKLTGFSLVGFAFTMLADLFWYPKMEWRGLCIPASFVAQLRTEAMNDIGGKFLSEGDVLAAWRNRLIAVAIQLKPTKPVLMLQYYNLFGVLKEFPVNRSYIGNNIVKMFAFMNVKELLGNSLGAVAMQMRQALKEQRSQEQSEAYLTVQKKQGIMLFGTWNQAFMGISNLDRADLYSLDFSAAVVGDSGSGEPVHVHNDFFVESKLKLRNVGSFTGKDLNGDWWISWSMRSEAWPRVEEQLAKMAGVKVIESRMV